MKKCDDDHAVRLDTIVQTVGEALEKVTSRVTIVHGTDFGDCE
ncbi:MAG: hypothetical protein RQ731_07035 [Anaerosomatales bacterium]|nr:hypothetical protein [Anaerosomatales bacterium]